MSSGCFCDAVSHTLPWWSFAGLAVSVFQHHPLHRVSVMEEVLSGVFGQMGSKNPPRHFIASAEENGGGVVRIQMATALIMQLVQVSSYC